MSWRCGWTEPCPPGTHCQGSPAKHTAHSTQQRRRQTMVNCLHPRGDLTLGRKHAGAGKPSKPLGRGEKRAGVRNEQRGSFAPWKAQQPPGSGELTLQQAGRCRGCMPRVPHLEVGGAVRHDGRAVAQRLGQKRGPLAQWDDVAADGGHRGRLRHTAGTRSANKAVVRRGAVGVFCKFYVSCAAGPGSTESHFCRGPGCTRRSFMCRWQQGLHAADEPPPLWCTCETSLAA